MHEALGHFITVFTAFFAIMNPIANTVVFASLTSEASDSKQASIAVQSLLFAFIIVVLFCLLGKSIFHIFGITLPALQITGGVLVFVIGYHMLHGEGSKLHQAQDNSELNVAISPLAVPLLAGPGTIATAMNFSSSGSWTEITLAIVAFAVLCVITAVCFVFSSKIISVVSKTGLSIVTRLMGLILAVIGVQMLVSGVQASFTSFAQ